MAVKESLTVAEVAAILGLHHKTVRRMIHAGRLPAFRTGTGGPHAPLRIAKVDLIAYRTHNPVYYRKPVPGGDPNK